MIVFTQDAYVHIGEHPHDPALLVVRGRFRGDVDRFLLAPIEIEVAEEDYRYQASAKRDDVSAALARNVRGIRYVSLLQSIRTSWRLGLVAAVNRLMAAAQHERQNLPRVPEVPGFRNAAVEEPWHLPHMENRPNGDMP